MYVVAVVKGHTDVINVQLEKQHATDAKRKGTKAHSVTPKWEWVSSVSSETSIDTAFLDVLTGDHNSSWIEEFV